jgi:hypothetical protein
MDLVDVYRIVHPITTQYTFFPFFPAAYGSFSKIDILGHKATLNKIEITPCILSDHNAMKLELNKKTAEKIHIFIIL